MATLFKHQSYYYQRRSRGHKARGQGQRHKKKIRGQGQPFRGQTLSRPRTRKLEAIAEDQGHRRKCSPKKVFKIFFSGEKGLKNVFSGNRQLRKTKIGLRKFCTRFLAFSNEISTVQKIVLSSSRGQGNSKLF